MASINAIATTALLAFKPPEKLTLSEWADRFAYLSVESSAEAQAMAVMLESVLVF